MTQNKTTIALAAALLLLIGGGIWMTQGREQSKHGTKSDKMAHASSTDAVRVSVATVANDTSALGDLENSWPGELLSFGDIGIQPRREGTIVEWRVNIGQPVKKGQMIARLSPPPATPELTAMLAEQTKMFAEAKVDAAAQVTFSERKKQQLLTLQEALQRSFPSSSTGQQTLIQAKEAVTADSKKMRSTLEQAIIKEHRMISGTETDVIRYYVKTLLPQPIYLKEAFGQRDATTRYTYVRALTNAARAIERGTENVEKVGEDYFQAATSLAVSVLASSEEASTGEVVDLRKMVSMDQMAFLEAVKDYRMSLTELSKMETEYKLMLSEREAEFSEQQKEIAEQVSMLERDITMNKGRVEAARKAYGTVAGSITGEVQIVAPASGVITSIMKKNGDFVEPGMAVASLNTGRKGDRFVRFRIPSNIRLPEPGSELLVTRPGFPKDVLHAKLIGIGTALNENGSYLADAKLMDDAEWPINISVRVLPNGHSTSSLFVLLSALEWENTGASIWVVRSDNTITKRAVRVGRTLGEYVELYEGLSVGDRYIEKPTPELMEDIKVEEGERASDQVKSEEDPHGHGND